MNTLTGKLSICTLLNGSIRKKIFGIFGAIQDFCRFSNIFFAKLSSKLKPVKALFLPSFFLSLSLRLCLSRYLILSLCFCHGLSFSLTHTSFDHVNLWLTGFSVTCCPIVTWPPLIRKYHQYTAAAGLSLNECRYGTVLYGKPFHADMLPCWAYYATTVATI